MLSTLRASSDVILLLPDPNPIIDVGCSRSIEGLISAVALCQALEIETDHLPLNRETFLHEFEKHCSNSQVAIGFWKLPSTDINGIKAKIPFYIARGDSFLLLDNEILQNSYLLGPESLIRILAGVWNVSNKDLLVQTYFEPTSFNDSETERKYLLVVPSKLPLFKSFLSSGILLGKGTPYEFKELRFCSFPHIR